MAYSSAVTLGVCATTHHESGSAGISSPHQPLAGAVVILAYCRGAAIPCRRSRGHYRSPRVRPGWSASQRPRKFHISLALCLFAPCLPLELANSLATDTQNSCGPPARCVGDRLRTRTAAAPRRARRTRLACLLAYAFGCAQYSGAQIPISCERACHNWR